MVGIKGYSCEASSFTLEVAADGWFTYYIGPIQPWKEYFPRQQVKSQLAARLVVP